MAEARVEAIGNIAGTRCRASVRRASRKASCRASVHSVTVRADGQGTRYEVTVYNRQTMSCEDLCTGGEVVYIHVAQGSGLCSCHSNTKSVQCIRVAITTHQVSAVTLMIT